MLLSSFLVLPLVFVTVAEASLNIFSRAAKPKPRKQCVVKASNSSEIDDAPAIIKAFKECNKHKGRVVFTNTTYYVNSVMNTTNLKDVAIDIKGTLLVSQDDFWGNEVVLIENLVVREHHLLAE